MTPFTTLDAAVFDFDGTLAELVLDFAAMKARVAEAAAPYLDPVPSPASLPALEYADRLAGLIRRDSSRNAGAFLEAVARAVRDQEIEAARRARLFPETREALSALARAGTKIGIITRNCRAAVDIVFPDAARYAAAVLARDDTRHVKPDPRHLLEALAILGAPAARSLMAGDHPMDLATGKAAGTLTAGVASGRVPMEELARHSPDFLAPDLATLVAMLA